MSDEARELVAYLGVCRSCGAPVLVWEVVGMSPDGVSSDTVTVCDNCETTHD